MFTEHDERQKWCPHSRIFRTEDSAPDHQGGRDYEFVSGINRDGFAGPAGQLIPEQCRCIASDCMMWRWLSAETGKLAEYPGGVFIGFCGIGGPPMQVPDHVVVDPGQAGRDIAKRMYPHAIIIQKTGPSE